MSLPFVPLSQIDEAFQHAKDYAKALHPNIYERTVEFLSYFENTWLLGSYSPLTWNFFASYNQRTNNVSEGYNHAFNSCREFGGITSHPNIFLLIQVVKKELLRSGERAQMYEIGQDPIYLNVDKHKFKQKQRHDLMIKLTNGQIQLVNYMDAVGRSALLTHYERVETQVHKSTDEDSDDDFEDIHNTPDHSEKPPSTGKKSGTKSNTQDSSSKKSNNSTGTKSNTNTSKEKKSNTKDSSSKKSDKQHSTGKKSNTKSSTDKKSDTNASSSKKSDKESNKKNSMSSANKPPTMNLFPPTLSSRTPKRLYLTGESKGKCNLNTFIL